MKNQSQKKDINLIRACHVSDVDGVRSAMAGATQGALDRGLRIAASLWSDRPENVEIARLLIRAGANPDSRSDSGVGGRGGCALHEAATNPTMTRLLLDAGADPNVRDEYGATPLYQVATTFGVVVGPEPQHALDNVRLLLEAGADAKAVEDQGYTALDEVNIYNNGGWQGYESILHEIALLLLKAGAPAPREPSPFVARAMDALAAEQRLASTVTSRQRRRA